MTKHKRVVPIPLLIISGVLLVLGVAANLAIQALVTPQQLAQNVLLSATPFILIFVAIVLAFIALVVFAGRALGGKIAQPTHRAVETVTIAGILLGVFGIFQQFVFAFFAAGFVLLLISTLAFILWSHIQPKRVLMNED